MATLKDVAERAGVTVTTVSRMLNKKAQVSKKTREKINQAFKELDYQPNELARSLSKKTSSFIGLIISSAQNYFYCKVIDYVERYSTQYGYKLLLCVSNHEPEKEREYFNMLKAHKVAGVILGSHTQNLDLSDANFESPIITFDRMISTSIPAVGSDNYHGGVLAAKHLLAKGCKKPAFFTVSPVAGFMANMRYNGFSEIWLQHDIKPIYYEAPYERMISMRYEDAIEDFFKQHPDVDSIFTSNDIAAVEFLRFCLRNGISVPQQVKVIGYDDIELAGIYTPALTTIRQPVEDICRFSVESIVNYKEKSIPISTIFPVQLIEREST